MRCSMRMVGLTAMMMYFRMMVGHKQNLEEVENREYENPHQINEVPEETRDFDPIGQVLRILSVQQRAARYRKPEVNEN